MVECSSQRQKLHPMYRSSLALWAKECSRFIKANDSLWFNIFAQLVLINVFPAVITSRKKGVEYFTSRHFVLFQVWINVISIAELSAFSNI